MVEPDDIICWKENSSAKDTRISYNDWRQLDTHNMDLTRQNQALSPTWGEWWEYRATTPKQEICTMAVGF